jgi:hypothetical protein
LTNRNQSKEKAAEQGKQQRQGVGPGIRIDRHIDGDTRNRPPDTQYAQNDHGDRHAQDSSGQRNQDGFRKKLAEDTLTRRSQSHAHRNLAGTISSSRGKEAAEVGARRKQDESGQEHQASHEGTRGTAQRISHQSWPR